MIYHRYCKFCLTNYLNQVKFQQEVECSKCKELKLDDIIIDEFIKKQLTYNKTARLREIPTNIIQSVLSPEEFVKFQEVRVVRSNRDPKILVIQCPSFMKED